MNLVAKDVDERTKRRKMIKQAHIFTQWFNDRFFFNKDLDVIRWQVASHLRLAFFFDNRVGAFISLFSFGPPLRSFFLPGSILSVVVFPPGLGRNQSLV